jgi:hypothetical protein
MQGEMRIGPDPVVDGALHRDSGGAMHKSTAARVVPVTA